MARGAPARAGAITAYAREVLGLFPRGRVLVGIDGLDGAGKTTFARALSAACVDAGTASAVVSLDDFQSAPSARDDPLTAGSWFEHGFDHDLLRQRVVEPLRDGEAIALLGRRIGDEAAVPDPPLLLLPEHAVLVVEGIFLHRRELVGLWRTSAWLDVAIGTAFARCVERDGWDPAPGAELESVFFAAERRYLAEADPRRRAGATFDLTDPAHPRRVLSGSR